MGISQGVINAIKTLLTGTKAIVNGEEVPIKIGVLQGSIISPKLFTLFINDLLHRLCSNEKHFWCESFAFADDLALVTTGRISLHRCISKMKEWCRENKMEINFKKCGILHIRDSKRTPRIKDLTVQNIPVVDEYKYLGIYFDDTLSFAKELQSRSNKLSKLVNSKWILQSNKFNAESKLHIWHTLFRSKVWYQTLLLINDSGNIRTWLAKYMYQQMKFLLNIQSNPSKDDLFTAILGDDVEETLSALYQNYNLKWIMNSLVSGKAERLK